MAETLYTTWAMDKPKRTLYGYTVEYDEYTEKEEVLENLLGTFYSHGLQLFEPVLSDDYLNSKKIAEQTETLVLDIPVYVCIRGKTIELSTTPYHKPWDSGLAAHILVTKGDVERCFGSSEVTDEELLERIKRDLRYLQDWANGELVQISVTVYERNYNSDRFIFSKRLVVARGMLKDDADRWIKRKLDNMIVLNKPPRKTEYLTLD